MADKEFGFSPGSVLPTRVQKDKHHLVSRYEGVLCLNPSRPLGQAKAMLGTLFKALAAVGQRQSSWLNYWTSGRASFPPQHIWASWRMGWKWPQNKLGEWQWETEAIPNLLPSFPFSLIRSSPSCSLHLTCPSLPACHCDWNKRRDESGPGSAQGAGREGLGLWH